MEYLNDIEENLIQLQNKNNLHWYMQKIEFKNAKINSFQTNIHRAFLELVAVADKTNRKFFEVDTDAGLWVYYKGIKDIAFIIYSTTEPELSKYFNHMTIDRDCIVWGEPIININPNIMTGGEALFYDLENAIKNELITEYGPENIPIQDKFGTYGKLKSKYRKRIKKQGYFVISD